LPVSASRRKSADAVLTRAARDVVAVPDGPSALAPNSVAVFIKLVDVRPFDIHRSVDIRRPVAATAGTVDVTGYRDAGTGVVRVAVGALDLR
jgi:hypothetical protein